MSGTSSTGTQVITSEFIPGQTGVPSRTPRRPEPTAPVKRVYPGAPRRDSRSVTRVSIPDSQTINISRTKEIPSCAARGCQMSIRGPLTDDRLYVTKQAVVKRTQTGIQYPVDLAGRRAVVI